MSEAIETLGTILDAEEDPGRDAIHVAVISGIAARKIFPGQDVGFLSTGVGPSENPVGIVDPYLKAPVMPGERFWVLLYPRTITSLRHVWSHPDFPEESGVPVVNTKKTRSRRWIEEFANTCGLSYDDLMQGADDFLHHRNYLSRGGLLEGHYVPDEFWDHYQKVTGKRVPEEEQESFFSCSC